MAVNFDLSPQLAQIVFLCIALVVVFLWGRKENV